MSVEQQPLFDAPVASQPQQGVLPNEPAPVPQEQPPAPLPPRDETERLDPQPTPYRLESGTEIDLEPLKLRQFLRLLRIVTRGAADSLENITFDFEDSQAFMQTFLGLVIFSIPEAENEAVDFIQSMVKPKGLTGDPKKDIPKFEALHNELDNPELEDVITIIELIFKRESEDLRALGKRLGSMMKVAEKMGATSSDSPTPAI
jgi:hypothetical protein